MKIPFMAIACYAAAALLVLIAIHSLLNDGFPVFYVIMAAIVGLGGAYIHGPGKNEGE